MSDKNCNSCVHFDANKSGFLPLCKNPELVAYQEKQYQKRLIVSLKCFDVRNDEILVGGKESCGRGGRYFEAVQRVLTDGERAVLDHFLN